MDYLVFRYLFRIVAVLVVLSTDACDRTATRPPDQRLRSETRKFTGKWSATGNRQMMQLEPGHQAAVFKLTGSLLLEGEQRLKRGFYVDLIGFSDNQSGMQGRSVWTDEHGDKVFSELQSEAGLANSEITGEFLGGTGPYESINGEYTFKWKRLTVTEESEISGRVVDFKGWACIKSPHASQDRLGDQQ